MMFGNGNPLSEISGSAFSENISSLLRKMVVSFARFGNPNVADLDWQEFDSPTRWTAEISESSDLLVDPFNRQRILLGRVMTDSWQVLGL
jgi:carboxylesterase type B